MADTSLPPVPVTLLDAVNALLRSVGLAVVDSLLDTDANVDSKNAFQAIGRANVQIQAKGWYCNTEDYTLQPSVPNGEVGVGNNWLHVRPKRGTSTWANMKITVRQSKLYDLKAHTFAFTKPVDVEVVQALDFEDLPQALRWYITCRGGREFAVGTYPSSGTFKFTEDEERVAQREAEQEDQILRDETMQESSPFFDKMRRR